jgi:hypothetical protein
MLRTLQIELELVLRSTSAIPQVRFWVDCDVSGDLWSETELKLELTRRWSWRATVDASGPFFYRLGISAPEGGVWSLRIRDCARQRDLLLDSDEIVTPKSWLIGSCELASRALSGRSAEDTPVVDLAHHRRE